MRAQLDAGRVFVNDNVVTDGNYVVASNDMIEHYTHVHEHPSVLPSGSIGDWALEPHATHTNDDKSSQFVAVNKPASFVVHPVSVWCRVFGVLLIVPLRLVDFVTIQSILLFDDSQRSMLHSLEKKCQSGTEIQLSCWGILGV